MISIPSSIEKLRSKAFSSSGVENITIGKNVSDIDTTTYAGSFDYCSYSLLRIVVDGDNKKYDSRNNCNAIIEKETNKLIVGCKNTIIPESIKAIGDTAFCRCMELTNIVIPDGVTSIRTGAFDNCTGLTNVSFPDSLTTIGVKAFYSCNSLTSITIPINLNNISSMAFGYCNSLEECRILSNLQKLENSIFTNCSKLKTINIPDSVTEIGPYVFKGCTSLTNLEIPSQVSTIYHDAFYNVPHISYTGNATGARWGAIRMN